MSDGEQHGTAPERQFDFWLGEWQVTWGEDGRGTNSIRLILDDRVLLENFDARPAMSFRGMSVSVYNAALGKWLQTWVDSQGSYLDFVGEFTAGQMILQRQAMIDGLPVLQRMVWYNIASDNLDWNWERSGDGGQMWQVLWKIHYTRAG